MAVVHFDAGSAALSQLSQGLSFLPHDGSNMSIRDQQACLNIQVRLSGCT